MRREKEGREERGERKRKGDRWDGVRKETERGKVRDRKRMKEGANGEELEREIGRDRKVKRRGKR